ncbi:MAG: DEAD/DEAH box helicase, partial [archaeon]|nr:DEAD/DEAH box helicase [archaeon]
KKFTFSYINTPFFKGTVVFGLDFKDKMRPLQFNKIQKDNTIDPVDPRLFKKLLLADEAQFVSFSSHAISEETQPIREMLNNFQFDNNKIKILPICNFCLSENKFTLLLGMKVPISHKDKIICSDCALKIVKRAAKSSGLIEKDRISPKLKNFLTHMILKFKNVQKILDVLKTDFDPSANRELTLYDTEKSPQISKKYLNYKIDDLDIPNTFKQVIKASKITTLLPIQAISIEKGLLSRKDQLIMAPTSGGKTLVGELSGISRVLVEKGAKMLYLVPIVALANIRTDEFSKKYKSINLKVLKRVGESILNKKRKDNTEDLKNADVIVATYEAIDYILRSGNKDKLGNVGTIVIDEIQTLIDPDRGFLLDGFISRLKSLFSKAQYLYLSATIGEPIV